ncbi:MAG: ERAP1-like C-terminal domain-containing protein [Deltaproteobacteria bacterium]|nr:ERAP1-like C-terminal domain-containing protein [Deltaproteobacteria bacterium]
MVRGLLGALLGMGFLSCGGADQAVPPPPIVLPGFRTEIPASLPTGQLPPVVRPLFYALSLEIDPSAGSFSGEVVIDLDVRRSTGAVVLHAADLRVTAAELVTGDRRVRAEVSMRASPGALGEREELVLVAPSPLSPGGAQVRIAYTAALTEDQRGLFRVRESGGVYAFTELEPADARRLLPCFDEPEYKAPFEVAVSVPTGNVVLANAREESRETSPDGKHTIFRFASTAPLPPYLLGLAVGPLELRDGPKGPVPLRLAAPRGRSAQGTSALEAAAALLRQLAGYFDRPYPFGKLDLLAVPSFAPGGSQSAGLVSLRDDLLLVDSPQSTAAARRAGVSVLAHELAHQWFGDVVTVPWWDEQWLNEGMATLLEGLLVDSWRPGTALGLDLLVDAGAAMDRDALGSARALRQPWVPGAAGLGTGAEEGDVKAAAVLGMIRGWLGDETFQRGLRAFVRGHELGNAGAEELWRDLSDASGQDVAGVARSYVDTPGVPLVRARLVCDAQGPRVDLSQERLPASALGRRAPGSWRIPVCLAFPTGWRATVQRQCVLLGEPSASARLQAERCPSWINPNADSTGYYRFALPAEQLAALGRAALKGEARDKIGFLGNAWALVQAGEMPAPELLAVLALAARERQRQVVEQVILTLRRVEGALVLEESRPAFQSFAGRLLLPAARQLGWEAGPEEDGEQQLLRPAVLRALGELAEDRWLAASATERAVTLIEGPGAADPELAALALRLGARRGGSAADFEKLVQAVRRTSIPAHRAALVQALASLRDPALLRRALGLTLDGTLGATDSLHALRAAAAYADSRRLLAAWLAEHAAELAGKLPGFALERMMAVVGRLCDREQRTLVAQALGPMVQPSPTAQALLGEALETADRCVELRARQAEATAAYLKRRRW